jgi:UPF0176 protein
VVVITALYHFTDLPDFELWKKKLEEICVKLDIKGILLVALEGINGTVAGKRESIDQFLQEIKSDDRFKNLEHKESFADETPFNRLKVKIKKEIVTLRKPEANPSKLRGTYVDPKEWNQLINDPDVVVIDTRNDYEVGAGKFKGALDPKTDTFCEFPDFVEKNLTDLKDKKIAMYCTGGIRCEKASAYMKYEGFKNVYHLKGGILKYLEEIPQEESLWEGKCFVFDQRVTVTHDLKPSGDQPCFGCRMPLSKEDRLSPYYSEGVHCHHCYDSLSETALSRYKERHKQVVLAANRGQKHIGIRQKRHVNNEI